MNTPRTLYEKIWDDHVVRTQDDGTSLIYIDRHLVHEVTSVWQGVMYHARIAR